MSKKRLIWQLFPSYILVTVLALLAIGILTTLLIRDFYYARTSEQLDAIARLVNLQVQSNYANTTVATLDSVCTVLGDLSACRVTLTDKSGTVMGDSWEDPRVMENHRDRPEIQAALHGETGESIRLSPTLNVMMMYYAVPLYDNTGVIGVTRVSKSLTIIDGMLHRLNLGIAIGGLVIIIMAALFSYYISRRFTKPIEEMEAEARKFAEGDLSRKLRVPKTGELGSLAITLNHTAEKLRRRIETITRQRMELETVLDSMIEGVLAVDNDERILGFNPAAVKILNFDAKSAKGRMVQEAIINPDLHELISSALKVALPLEREITIRRATEHHINLQSAPLIEESGRRIGTLIVLNDITKLRRLETVRKEFVANVSHELRTPVTSIQGFVETLRDGAIHSREDSLRFLDIIHKHVGRLNAIIDDLLTLSQIEREAEDGDIPLTEGSIPHVLKKAVEVCQTKAEKKQIALEILIQDVPGARINEALLEQAVVNLLDNAINYSEEKSDIVLGVEESESDLTIYVKDRGIGIPDKHQPRIFERFYRVDSDRSRRAGGTGLGLAIVKHIAISHGGYVDVESKVGEGSIFRIHIPRA